MQESKPERPDAIRVRAHTWRLVMGAAVYIVSMLEGTGSFLALAMSPAANQRLRQDRARAIATDRPFCHAALLAELREHACALGYEPPADIICLQFLLADESHIPGKDDAIAEIQRIWIALLGQVAAEIAADQAGDAFNQSFDLGEFHGN